MAARGYRYGSPMDAIDDPRFGKATAESTEISTARADVECKKKTGLVRTWFDVESAMQQSEIDKNTSRWPGSSGTRRTSSSVPPPRSVSPGEFR